MIPRTREFKKRLPIFIADTKLRQNVARNTWTAVIKRNKSVAEVENWEDLREKAYRIKQAVLNALEENLSLFQKNAEANGVNVLWASDAKAANALAEQIARKHGVRKIVKSKSMMTEEIGFNEYMQKRGYEVLETDLGEFIVQLADEPPSNLISPAMHKSLADIAQLFSEKLGIPYREDPQYLTRVARKILRSKFMEADMGVTGANFAIVENGAVAIVENEGNARMCTTLPGVHVAVLGIEKLIPTMADLGIFLTLLCRSGTGQKLTSYVSILYGLPRVGELDGPRHIYYILVDNGRRRMLKDAMLRQALYCIRCSACYNICPVYQNLGGHAYGWVYQGPIGSILTPEFVGLENAANLPFASTLCGNCSEVCPVKIPLHHLLVYQRMRVVQRGLNQPLETVFFKMFRRIMVSPKFYERAGNFLRLVQKFLSQPKIPRWSRSRVSPKLSPLGFRQWWRKRRVPSDD